MILVDIIYVALPGSIADAAGIDAGIVNHGLSRCTFHAQQSQLTCQLNLIIGYIANLSTGLTYQPQAMSR